MDVMDEYPGSGIGVCPDSFAHDKNREGTMKDALVMMSTYPPRPAELLAPSPSVEKVRAVLADAPQKGSRRNEGITITASQYDEYGDPVSFKYRWSEEYLERLFTALIEVIEEHGTGPEGFEGIRWEVYEKVCVTPATSLEIYLCQQALRRLLAVCRFVDGWPGLRPG